MWVRKCSRGALDLRFLLRRSSLFQLHSSALTASRDLNRNTPRPPVDKRFMSAVKQTPFKGYSTLCKLRALPITHSGCSTKLCIISCYECELFTLRDSPNSESNRIRTFISCAIKSHAESQSKPKHF